MNIENQPLDHRNNISISLNNKNTNPDEESMRYGMKTWIVRPAGSISVILTIILAPFYPALAESQPKGILHADIFSDKNLKTAEGVAIIVQNMNTLTAFAEGEVSISDSDTLLTDVTLAVKAYQQYNIMQASKIRQQIVRLETLITETTRQFSGASSAELDDILVKALDSVDDLKSAEAALAENARVASSIPSKLSKLQILGMAASGVDTAITTYDLVKTIEADATKLEIGIAVADTSLSAVSTGLVIAGSKFVPAVALASGITEISVWGADKIGDAVYERQNAQTSLYYQSLKTASEIIQSRILSGYLSGKPLSPQEIDRLVRQTYADVKSDILSYGTDSPSISGWIDSLITGAYGTRKINKDVIAQVISTIDSLLDGRGYRLALEYDNLLRSRFDSVSNLKSALLSANETIVDIRDSTFDISIGAPTLLPNDRTVFRTSDPSESDVVLDKGTIGPSIPDNTTDVQIKIIEDARPVEPPPDYTAQIAALKAQRDTLIIARIDAEFVVSESNNRLAVLRYEDLETVNYYLGVVNAEVAELRAELANGPLSPQDAARYQSLLTYQETLEAENDRINDLIEAEELKIENARLAIQEANHSLVPNQSELVGYGFNMATYVPPTHNPGTPTDWTGYEYEPPPFPGQSPVFSNPHGFIAGGLINPNETFASNKVPVVENGVTKFKFPPYQSGGEFVLVPKTERTSPNFSYLAWGTDTAYAVPNSGASVAQIEKVFWLYGEQTPTSVLEARTGSADFTGNIYGHYYRWPTGGTSTVEHDAVTGALSFNANFASDTITGSGRFNVASNAGNFSETFSLSGSLSDDNTSYIRNVSGNEGGLSYGISSTANIVAGLTGTSGSGFATGSFYGPDGIEAGGNIGYFFGDRESAIAGVWTSTFQGDFPDFKALHLSSSSLNVDIVSSATYLIAPVIGDTPNGQKLVSTGEYTSAVVLTSLPSQSVFDYSNWGSWEASDSNSDGSRDGGYWVAGEATDLVTLSNKTGSATYSGKILGEFTNDRSRSQMNGDISLTADFDSLSLNGSMRMNSGEFTTGDLPINTSIPQSNDPLFNFSDLSGGNFGVQGQFFGPDANEVGGLAWAVTSDGSYNGVFQAGQ